MADNKDKTAPAPAEATKDDKANAASNDQAKVSSAPKAAPFHADRQSDLNPLADKEAVDGKTDTSGRDLTGTRQYGQLDRGEQLAQEAVKARDAQGGDVKLVEKDGVTSAVANPRVDNSDNGKVYADERINPRDTNAPDAGLTPDGRRIAQ